MMGKLAKVARMEFKLTAANRAFIVLTILGPFLIVAVSVLPSLLTMNRLGSPEVKIAIVGGPAGFAEGIRPALTASGMRLVDVADPSSLDAQVLSGALDGYLTLPADLEHATQLEYVSKNVADFRTTGALQGIIGQSIVAMRLVRAGLPAAQIASVVTPPQITVKKLEPTGQKKNQDFVTVLMTGLVLVMLLYMTVLLYGQAIGRSVLSEKTSKTVEIMLSSVRPLDLMYGKIAGKAAASLLQYAVWVVMAAAFLSLFGSKLGVNMNLGITPQTLGFLVLFFLLAFLLYSSIYAALGSAAEDDQHLTQLAWPVIIFLVIPIVMISPIIMNPSAPFVVVLSLFPLTGAVVMFLRIVVGGAPVGEVLASIALQLGTIVLAVYLSAKIFRVGLLMTGKRFTFAEIVKWLRY